MRGEQNLTASKRNGTARHIRNILLIEDDDDTRYVIQSALEDEGYAVRASIDRDEAIQNLGKALFQVIIMDYFMPGKSAGDFVRMVQKVSPQTEIVIITAAEKAADVALSLGLRHSVGKHLNMDELLALLERLEKDWT
jgi:CheY-like chemotaxis protein